MMTKVVLIVAQTRMKMPAPSRTLDAIFFRSFKDDFHSIGMGMRIK